MSHYEIQYNLGKNAWAGNALRPRGEDGWTTSLNFEPNYYDTAEDAFAELGGSNNTEYASEDFYRVVLLDVVEVIPRPKPPESTEWEMDAEYTSPGFVSYPGGPYPFQVKAVDETGSAWVRYPDGSYSTKRKLLRDGYVKV